MLSEPSAAAERNANASAPGASLASRLLAGGLIVGAVALGLFFHAPPPVAPVDAPPEQFSAARARQHLAIVAAEPHPVGSAHHARIRDYLLSSLTDLGVDAELQRTKQLRPPWSGTHIASPVENVIGRLRGRESTGAILIVGHYDSVVRSPGASDDGAAVVAMLETVRALRAGPPLRNDVIFLFSDAEEVNLLGAQAFAREHPAMREVRVVLNYEARGVTGPSLMFEPGERSGWLVEAWAASDIRPIGTSVAAAVYEWMSNDTDFTVFREASLPGLNFAYIESYHGYHSGEDDLSHTDLRSVQHHGASMVALARALGDVDLQRPRDGDAVYFNVGPLALSYPAALAVPLAGGAVALTLVLLVVAVRRGHARLGRVLVGGALAFAVIAASALLVFLLLQAALVIDGEAAAMPLGEPYDRAWYAVGCTALAVAGALGASRMFARWVAPVEQHLGYLLVLGVAAGALAWFAPGASYLVTAPILLAAIPISAELVQRPRLRAGLATLGIAAAVPGVLLFVPLIHDVYVALTIHAAPIIAVLVAILVQSVDPVLHRVLGRRGAAFTALGLGAAGAVLIVIAAAAQGFDREDPRPNSVRYVLDADTQRALWISSDRQLDSWTRQLLGGQVVTAQLREYLPDFLWNVHQGSAPSIALQPPKPRVISDVSSPDGTRTLTLEITSPRQAPVVEAHVRPARMLRAAILDGMTIQGPALLGGFDDTAVLRYWQAPPEGFILTLITQPGVPITMRLADMNFELPHAAGLSIPERPGDMAAAPFDSGLNEGTMVTARYTF